MAHYTWLVTFIPYRTNIVIRKIVDCVLMVTNRHSTDYNYDILLTMTDYNRHSTDYTDYMYK